jgi:putative ABC transport system permease protein
LLIACANVANLMLARAATRQREIAVRTAIGANGRRIFTQLITESVVSAASAGVAGAFAAYWGVRLPALAFPDGVPSYIDLSVDATVLIFTTVVALATGLIFGLVPAVRAMRVDLVPALREGGRSIGGGRIGRWVRKGLVPAELALSLVLMVSAVLLLRTDIVLEHEIGFQPQGVLSIRIPVRMPKYVGLRMALGASRRDVASLVIKESASLCLPGVTMGIAVSLALTRFLRTLLYGIQANDIATLAAASAVIVFIVALASLVPALRASKVDPMIALRSE